MVPIENSELQRVAKFILDKIRENDKDQYEGQAIYRDPLGNVVAKGLYKKGKKVGMWQFYEGGKLVSEENMSKVKKANPATPKSK